MEGHSREVDQLVYLLNSMFSKESLRKNVYLFNALTPQLTLPLRVISKERRVASITQELPLLTAAVKLCSQLQLVSPNEVRVLVPGDQLVVRLSTTVGKISRKQVTALIKQMKCHYRQEKDCYFLEFHSHAAAVEFMERAKAHNKGYECQLLEKDPYKCLQEAIANHRKQKRTEKPIIPQNDYYNSQIYYVQEYFAQLAMSYPLFVRRAVDSDSEQSEHDLKSKGREESNIRANEVEGQESPFSAQNFPTLEESLPQRK